jgi:hypothetical protein
MTKQTVYTVLRASTAKVQPRYRGKYPNRLRSISAGNGRFYAVSNDHRVLDVAGQDHKALVLALGGIMPTMQADIETLAQHVADYRNAMSAGRAAGPVARHVAATINRNSRLTGYNPTVDDNLAHDEEHYRYAVITATWQRADYSLSVRLEKFNRARSAAWEAGKADARVTACNWFAAARRAQLAHERNVKAGPVARTVMQAIEYAMTCTRSDWVLLNHEASSSAFNVTALAHAAGTDIPEDRVTALVINADDAQRTDELSRTNPRTFVTLSRMLDDEPATVKAGKVAQWVADLIADELESPEADRCDYGSAVVVAHCAAFPSQDSYVRALAAATSANRADERKQAGADLQAALVRVTNGNRVGLFDDAGRFVGYAPKAGPIADAVSRAIRAALMMAHAFGDQCDADLMHWESTYSDSLASNAGADVTDTAEARRNDERTPVGPVARALITDAVLEDEATARFHRSFIGRNGVIDLPRYGVSVPPCDQSAKLAAIHKLATAARGTLAPAGRAVEIMAEALEEIALLCDLAD